MPVLSLYTDPACSASWAAEPRLRRLEVEFGSDLEITYVMGGLARELSGDVLGRVLEWLDAGERSGMPLDPRIWHEAPLASTYPACMAVKAAGDQGREAQARLLRTLREGIMCHRRKLDGTEALVEAAREAGLDARRFRIDLGSHATVEAFGADLEKARTVPEAARERGLAWAGATVAPGGERLALPSLRFSGDGEERWCGGQHAYEDWRAAALAVGAKPDEADRPDVAGALGRFGRLAGAEVEAVCGLAAPRAGAELWRLASEWRVKPTRVLTGTLWELA